MAAVIQRKKSNQALSILEIGAGTGGTTANILPVLENADVSYVFTDISPLFLEKAQSKFAYYPFISYQVLDIERNPEEQGFDLHKFDIILATNVLHATRNLYKSLSRAQKLLAPGGLLL